MPVHQRLVQPVLAAGARIVRRGRGTWQIGIDPGRRVILPGSPGVDAELDALRIGATASGTATDLSEALDRAGLLARPRAHRLRVIVRGALGPDDARLIDMTATRVDQDAPGLLLSLGEPARELLDDWLREGRSHMVVRVVDGRIVIGPLVVPGRTACLRCIDCHLVDI
ncbi:MAG: hypothetical protein ACTHJH_08485, partial [Marmoricola sp.]